MKQIRRIIVIFIVSLVIYSCGPGIGDVTEKLSGNYVYRADGDARYILADNIFKNGIYPQVITYNFDNNFILVLQNPSRKHIISFFAEDLLSRYSSLALLNDTSISLTEEDYKLFRQAFLADSVLYKYLFSEVALTTNNSMEDHLKSDEIALQIIDTSFYFQKMITSELNYWIINHKENEQLGPFTRSKFHKKAIELKVPNDLINKFENSIN